MKERGSVLLSAIFVMVLLLLLGTVLLRLMKTEMEISQQFSDGISAYYAAEAGVKWALVELDNQTTQKNFTELLEKCSYSVYIKDGSSKVEKVISAAGTSNGAVRKVSVDILLMDTPPFACFSGEGIILRANVCGLVGLRGTEIMLEDGSSIVDPQGNALKPQINADLKLPAIRLSFNEKKYKNAQRLSNVLDGGTYNLKGTYFVDGDFVTKDVSIAASETSATIFVKGKTDFAGSISGNITLISTDTVTINSTGEDSERILKVYSQQGIVVNQPINGQALLMSKGDIKLGGSLYGAVITEGNAFIDSPLEGSVLAEKMIMQSGRGDVKYNEHIFRSLGLTRPQVISWSF